MGKSDSKVDAYLPLAQINITVAFRCEGKLRAGGTAADYALRSRGVIRMPITIAILPWAACG